MIRYERRRGEGRGFMMSIIAVSPWLVRCTRATSEWRTRRRGGGGRRSTAMMGTLGWIPVETRIAPKRENWQLSPHQRGVGELCAWSWRVFGSDCGRPRRAAASDKTERLRFVHGISATDRCAVHESAWILMGMPLPAATAPKHSCATTAKVKILHWGPSHVEMPTPKTKREWNSLPLREWNSLPLRELID